MKIEYLKSVLFLVLMGNLQGFSQQVNTIASGNGRNLEVLSVGSDGELDVTKYSYDKFNRIISIKTSITQTTVDWSNCSNGTVTMDFSSESGQLRTVFFLDEHGRAVKSITSDKNGELVTNEYKYNSQGYLRIVKDSGENGRWSGVPSKPSETKLTYINGGLASVVVTTEESEYDVAVTYKNDTKVNNGNFNLNSLFWPEGVASLYFGNDASQVGLLGKCIDNLPVKMWYYVSDENGSTNNEISISYKLDKSNYINTMTIASEDQDSINTDFIWE